MTVHLQERPSAWLSLLLAASILAFTLFGALFAATHDWLAGAFAVVAAAGAVRLGWLRFSCRTGRETPSFSVDAPRPTALGEPQDSARPFVGRARHLLGPRSREGFIVVGRDLAGFVPTTAWRHLGVEIALTLVGTRLPLTRFELDAVDSLPFSDALAELVARRDGCLIDESWAWARRGKFLLRSQENESLTLVEPCPPALIGRWPDSPMGSDAQLRRTMGWILGLATATILLFAGAGLVVWRLTDDSDYLVAGLSYAGLVGIAVVGGLIFGRKLVVAEKARRGTSSEPNE